MANNGISKRIQRRVIELVKETGCWNPEKNFGDCIEQMALFCIDHKQKLEKWKKLKKEK